MGRLYKMTPEEEVREDLGGAQRVVITCAKLGERQVQSSGGSETIPARERQWGPGQVLFCKQW